MMTENFRTLKDRSAVHRALGDERRLAIVDALHHTDRTVGALCEMTGLSTNLLAFHLGVLEDAGVIERTVSQGDARRRYVALRHDRLLLATPPPLGLPARRVLFVCTANSARSPLAACLWHARTGEAALSAGTQPADRVHPTAIRVARRHGLDLGEARPSSYRDVRQRPEFVAPDFVVSVCDRAHEDAPGFDAPQLHWSIPDPVGQGEDVFEDVFATLSRRVDRLARAASST